MRRDRDGLVAREVLGGLDDHREQLTGHLKLLASREAQFGLFAAPQCVNDCVVPLCLVKWENDCAGHSITRPIGPVRRDLPVVRLVITILLREI